MKIRLPDKVSLQLGAIASSSYMMAAVCPCCGRPAMGCGMGAGGALLVGGVTMALAQAGHFLSLKRKGSK